MSRNAWLAVAVPVVFVAFLSLREIGTADFWWQWAAGRHILEHGVPSLDPWLTTAEQRPWIEMRWLYCVGLYLSVENVGAWMAIVIAATLYSVGLGFTLGSGRPLLGVGVVAAIAIGRRLAVRPEAFTFAFLGLILFVIARVRQEKLNPKWALLWIGLIQIVWANTHALFAIGPIFLALWFIVEVIERGRHRRDSFFALALTVACSFINPYGLTGVLFPFTLFAELHGGAYTGNIVELRSPFTMGLSPSLVAHLLLAALVVFCSMRHGILVWRRQNAGNPRQPSRAMRGDVLLLLFAAATFYLSLTAVRNVPLFVLCAAAYLTSCDFAAMRSRAVAVVSLAAVAVFAYMFAIGTWSVEERLGLRIDTSRYGLRAAAALTADEAPVFNTIVEGSLLEALGMKAYCDPRLEVLPQDRFLDMMAIARLRKPLPDEFRSVLLILDCPLAAALAKRGGWQVVGMDSVAISMVRNPGAKISVEELKRRAVASMPVNPPRFSWFQKSLSPSPYRRMATFFANLGEWETAERWRAEGRRIYPAF